MDLKFIQNCWNTLYTNEREGGSWTQYRGSVIYVGVDRIGHYLCIIQPSKGIVGL